jgi:hypothetical protein
MKGRCSSHVVPVRGSPRTRTFIFIDRRRDEDSWSDPMVKSLAENEFFKRFSYKYADLQSTLCRVVGFIFWRLDSAIRSHSQPHGVKIKRRAMPLDLSLEILPKRLEFNPNRMFPVIPALCSNLHAGVLSHHHQDRPILVWTGGRASEKYSGSVLAEVPTAREEIYYCTGVSVMWILASHLHLMTKLLHRHGSSAGSL